MDANDVDISMKNNLTLLAGTSLLMILLIACGDGLIIKKIYSDADVLYQAISMDKDSTLQGVSTTYYENGTDIFEKSNYLNGELHGVREIFYPDGNVEVREQYLADVLVDTLFTFHKNGNVRNKSYYSKGTLTGKAFKYYESGTIQEEVSFENDEENGPFIEYHENGNLKWKGTYLEGSNEVGELTEYNEDGELLKRMICDDLSRCKTVWTIEKGDIATTDELSN